MGRLLWMQCFVRVVETGSFTAVAREMNIGQPNVSRHIVSLEEYLGVRLLNRSTRKLHLTPEGERYYADARRALDAIQEADSRARGDDMPRGVLRVACSVALAHWHIRPLVPAFLERYPEIELELQISDDTVDLIGEGVDFAVRVGALKSSSLHARRIGFSERACVATTAYLERHSEPRVPEDLVGHNCILYTYLASGNVWTFKDIEVTVKGRYRVNSPDAIRAAVLSDMGIGYVPVWMFEKELRDGTVKLLLPDFPSPPGEIHLVYPARRLLSRRASLFMDLIAESFAATPSLRAGSIALLIAQQPDQDAKPAKATKAARRAGAKR